MTTAAPTRTEAVPHHENSIKETLISMIISLAMALVAKSYVVEAFVIPTGSMAPTLLGKHMQFQSPESGWRWTVNPWFHNGEMPVREQWRPQDNAPMVTDPMSSSVPNTFVAGQQPRQRINGYTPPLERKFIREGDRILVQKYLYEIFPPKRFDVVVFKNPTNSSENYIKRLIGLPNEQVWLADGDVFTRPISVDEKNGVTIKDPKWSIARKPERVQKALWRQVYSSEYAPLMDPKHGENHFSSPWVGAGWKGLSERTYRCEPDNPAPLSWDTQRWPITDWVNYNDTTFNRSYDKARFPVGDLRVRAGVLPDAEGLRATINVRAEQHDFQASIEGTNVTLRMRAVSTGTTDAEWTVLESGTFKGFPAGRVTNFELWHVDQSLQLWVDGTRVLSHDYDWSASERLLHATGVAGDAHIDEGMGDSQWLTQPDRYRAGAPAVYMKFEGTGVTLHRVALDRDVFYEPAMYYDREPALATHPDNLPSLNNDQYFCCGDNSPNSADGRLWSGVDPWISDQIDPMRGIVPRRLMLGKAFYVYFPAPYSVGKIPIPDLGRMRFIK